MKRILMGIAATALIFSSCSQNEVLNDITTSADNAIGFGVYAGKQTKAGSSFVTGTTFPDGGKFGVFAYYTGQAAWATAGATTTSNFMFKQEVTKSGSAYNYTPIKYWPNTAGDKVTFIAYYPFGGTGIVLQEGSNSAYTNTSTGLPKIDFTVQSSAADQVDLMCSDVLNDKSKNDGTIKFTFKHTLAQIKFSAKMAAALEDATTVTINSIAINKVSTNGDFHIGNSSTPWQSVGIPGNYTVTGAGTSFTKTDGTSAKDLTPNDADKFLMIPQIIPNDATIDISYTVSTTDTALDGGKSDITNTVSLSIGDGTLKWDMNKQIRYTLTISLTKVELSADVTDWDPTEDPR